MNPQELFKGGIVVRQNDRTLLLEVDLPSPMGRVVFFDPKLLGFVDRGKKQGRFPPNTIFYSVDNPRRIFYGDPSRPE